VQAPPLLRGGQPDQRLAEVRRPVRLAEIHQDAGSYVTALPYVLSCLSLCETYHMDSLFAIATIQFADIQLSLGYHQKAVSLIHSIFPKVMRHCSPFSQATAHFVLAKCSLAQSDTPKLYLVVDLLKKAEAGYSKCEALDKMTDMFYRLARLYDQMGLLNEREQASKKFCEALKLAETRAQDNHNSGLFYNLDEQSIQAELHRWNQEKAAFASTSSSEPMTNSNNNNQNA